MVATSKALRYLVDRAFVKFEHFPKGELGEVVEPRRRTSAAFRRLELVCRQRRMFAGIANAGSLGARPLDDQQLRRVLHAPRRSADAGQGATHLGGDDLSGEPNRFAPGCNAGPERRS